MAWDVLYVLWDCMCVCVYLCMCVSFGIVVHFRSLDEASTLLIGIVSYRFPLLLVVARCALCMMALFAFPTALVSGASSSCGIEWDDSLLCKPDGSDVFRFFLAICTQSALGSFSASVTSSCKEDDAPGWCCCCSSSTYSSLLLLLDDLWAGFFDTRIGSNSRRMQAHSPPSVMTIVDTVCKIHHAPQVGKCRVCIHTNIRCINSSVSTKSRTSFARWTSRTSTGMTMTAFTSQTSASVQPKTVSVRISVSLNIASSDNSSPVNARAIKSRRLMRI